MTPPLALKQQTEAASGCARGHPEYGARLPGTFGPDKRTDPRLEFPRCKGLGDEVTGAGIEHAHPPLRRVGGGEDQHRHRRLTGPQAPEYFQPGDTRSSRVEDHRIGRIEPEGVVGAVAGYKMIHGVAGLPKRAAQAVCNDLIVFHQQDAHRLSACALPAVLPRPSVLQHALPHRRNPRRCSRKGLRVKN